MKGLPITRFIPAIVWFVIVLILIALPGHDFPNVDDWYHKLFVDKWIHAGIFGLLAFLFMFPFFKIEKNQSTLLKVFIKITWLTIIWGFITECIQLFVPGRSFDLLDAAADGAGAFIAFWWCKQRAIKKI